LLKFPSEFFFPRFVKVCLSTSPMFLGSFPLLLLPDSLFFSDSVDLELIKSLPSSLSLVLPDTPPLIDRPPFLVVCLVRPPPLVFFSRHRLKLFFSAQAATFVPFVPFPLGSHTPLLWSGPTCFTHSRICSAIHRRAFCALSLFASPFNELPLSWFFFPKDSF